MAKKMYNHADQRGQSRDSGVPESRNGFQAHRKKDRYKTDKDITRNQATLADNGRESANVAAFELSASGKQESTLFFCDPYCSSQKPHVEKGHTLLYDILPKGSSFESLTQEDVDLAFSHINGVLRRELRGRSAFDAFSFLYSDKLVAALGIHFADPDDVIQSSALLK